MEKKDYCCFSIVSFCCHTLSLSNYFSRGSSNSLICIFICTGGAGWLLTDGERAREVFERLEEGAEAVSLRFPNGGDAFSRMGNQFNETNVDQVCFGFLRFLFSASILRIISEAASSGSLISPMHSPAVSTFRNWLALDVSPFRSVAFAAASLKKRVTAVTFSRTEGFSGIPCPNLRTSNATSANR